MERAVKHRQGLPREAGECPALEVAPGAALGADHGGAAALRAGPGGLRGLLRPR